MKSDATLDVTGLLCPMPIVHTAKKIKELKVGQVLEVVATDEGIKEDMPAWCKNIGHEYLGVEENDSKYRTFVKRLV